MKTILIALIFASVCWGQVIRYDTLQSVTYNGSTFSTSKRIIPIYKSGLLPDGELKITTPTIPNTIKFDEKPKIVFSYEYETALSKHLLSLLKEYKIQCDIKVNDYEDKLFEQQNGYTLKEYYANKDLHGAGMSMNSSQVTYRNSLKASFEGFIDWLEQKLRRVK